MYDILKNRWTYVYRRTGAAGQADFYYSKLPGAAQAAGGEKDGTFAAV